MIEVNQKIKLTIGDTVVEVTKEDAADLYNKLGQILGYTNLPVVPDWGKVLKDWEPFKIQPYKNPWGNPGWPRTPEIID